MSRDAETSPMSNRGVGDGACAVAHAAVKQWPILALACVGLAALTACSGWASRQPFDGTRWDNRPASVPASVEHGSYRSAMMSVDVGYNVYLPAPYAANPTKRFPVIYWLHGQNGNENSDVQPLVNVMSPGSPPAIMVFVNGGRSSKYRDAAVGSPMHGIVMAESTIINELIPHIDATYRTTASKAGRAIQGVSMGGMGALRLAFKYPQLFSSVFGFAPAINDNASNVMANERALMAAMLNDNPSLFDAENPQTIAANNAANIRGLPIHIVIGATDGLLADNQALDGLLTSLRIPHDPLEIVGGAGHDLDGLHKAIGQENFRFAAKSFR
jgi:S-formylglutathione hydrolase FrmB